ncbi:MAG: hypothetical protein C0417_11135 [Chlorobiaceae bacterium]|nr:hypothetical protein [Chlorobiaceae bacterium]
MLGILEKMFRKLEILQNIREKCKISNGKNGFNKKAAIGVPKAAKRSSFYISTISLRIPHSIGRMSFTLSNAGRVDESSSDGKNIFFS